jgi:hypothetical protein
MSKRSQPVILGLDAYGLTKRELYRLGDTSVEIEAHLGNSPDVYPAPARLRRLLGRPPQERRAGVWQWRIRRHNKLRAAVSPHKFRTLYYNRGPVGIRVSLPARELRRLFTKAPVDMVKIVRIKGRRRKRVPESKTPGWFAVKARFALQIEGETGGTQTYEDRIVLVLARSPNEAGRKAMREFRRYEVPSLMTTGHFWRWAFESILDVYDLYQQTMESEGTEVYSEFKRRRMKPAYEWHPSGKRGEGVVR